MSPLPTLRQLRHLAALADHRHFGRAAAACGVTQSTLSASLKELEDVLQAPLVDRTKRSVVLTPLGEEVVGRARGILHDTEELVRVAEADRAPLSGTLRLGVIPTIGPFLLPRILPKLRKAYPRLRLYLTEDQTARLLDDLEAGRLDAVLLALPYDLGRLETAVLFDDPFSVVIRRDHKLAKSPELAPQTLDNEALLLLRDGHCLKDHALSACRLDAPRHVDAFEATSLHTLVQMVDNGLGVTLLPQLALDANILKGTDLIARPLEKDAPARQIALAWRRGTGRRGEFQLLARAITDLAQRNAAPRVQPAAASKALRPAR
jgi:LysR family transcriptional regulator, hydrogen peroxide-inducible genes activator